MNISKYNAFSICNIMGGHPLVTIFLTLEHSFKVVPNLSSPVLKIGGSYKLEIFDQCYFKHIGENRIEIGKGAEE